MTDEQTELIKELTEALQKTREENERLQGNLDVAYAHGRADGKEAREVMVKEIKRLREQLDVARYAIEDPSAYWSEIDESSGPDICDLINAELKD